MSDVNRDFLHLLDLMTSPLLSGDGFQWVIKQVHALPEGPCAMFYYDWHKTRVGEVSAPQVMTPSCMSLRYTNQGFELRPETCTLGKQSTDAMNALQNRFTRGCRALRQ